MRYSIFYTVAAIINAASASYRGFNYAAQGNDRESFYEQFSMSTSLPGTTSFSSARLYTMIQEGGNETVIQAIPAALATNTKLLLGLWTSVDENGFAKQLRALESAMTLYGPQGLSDLVIGISVGSEDLYRSSVLGVSSDSGVGQDISVLLGYIEKVRTLLQGSVLQHIPVGVSISTHRACTWVMLTTPSACRYFGRLHKPYEQPDPRGCRLRGT
jgi:glucan endo-1,3-beta-D-glucosidase